MIKRSAWHWHKIKFSVRQKTDFTLARFFLGSSG
jgi:hypothetical protein